MATVTAPTPATVEKDRARREAAKVTREGNLRRARLAAHEGNYALAGKLRRKV